MRVYYFRKPGGNVLHLIKSDSPETACGRSTSIGARFSNADASPDVLLTPICKKCRKETWEK